MGRKKETLNLTIDDISDEGIDFNSIDPIEEDDDSISIEEPKTQESLNSVNSDDSVRIYLQQIGKIPLLSAQEELEVAKKIYQSFEANHQKEYSGNKNYPIWEWKSTTTVYQLIEALQLTLKR